MGTVEVRVREQRQGIGGIYGNRGMVEVREQGNSRGGSSGTGPQ